jgi:hypothetical protein
MAAEPESAARFITFFTQRHAVLGSAGTIVAFRVGGEDAPYLAREFHARFETLDLIQLENHHINLMLIIDGMPSKPFSAITLPPK